MKREKKVFRNTWDVIHTFAQQSQEYGTNPGRTVYFEGPVLYSYGYHYEIARFVEFGEKKIVLMNIHSYSPSTGKHLNMAERALTQYERFWVDTSWINEFGYSYYRLTPGRIALAFVNQIKDLIEKTKKARGGYPGYCFEIERVKTNLQSWLDVSGFTAEDIPFEPDPEKIAKWNKYNDEQFAKRQAKWEAEQVLWKKRIEQEREKQKEKLEKWLAGESVNPNFYLNKQMLRLKNGVVETTMGANVPEREARILWEKIKKGEDIIGWKVGNYTVISINGDLRIGCHVFDRSELERFTNLVGW